MMSAPCGAFCVCCVLSCYFLSVPKALYSDPRVWSDFFCWLYLYSVQRLTLPLAPCKGEEGKLWPGNYIFFSGFCSGPGNWISLHSANYKATIILSSINTIHQQPPSNLPVCPKEQPKWKPFLASSLSVLLLLQEEDPWGKWGSIFSPGQCLSTYTRTCLSITGLECPARGLLVSPGRGEFPCLGHCIAVKFKEGWVGVEQPLRLASSLTQVLFYVW